MVWHQNIWRERVFPCPLYLADYTSVPLRTTHFLYRDRSLLSWALGRSVHPVLPRGTLFQLGYGTHHWHSNSSSVCSRRHCLRDCHRTRLSDSSLLFVRFEVSVYYYFYYSASTVNAIGRIYRPSVDRTLLPCSSSSNGLRYSSTIAMSTDHRALDAAVTFCRPMLCISAAIAVMRCPSVCLSRSWVAPKRIKISSIFFQCR